MKIDRPPAVSVIIPYYKNASTIEDCLLSILSQSFTDIEMIVVNDASPDIEYLHGVTDRLHDMRLRLLSHTENRGRGSGA